MQALRSRKSSSLSALSADLSRSSGPAGHIFRAERPTELRGNAPSMAKGADGDRGARRCGPRSSRAASRCAASCVTRGGSGRRARADHARRRSPTRIAAPGPAGGDPVIHLAATIRDQPREHRGAQRAGDGAAAAGCRARRGRALRLLLRDRRGRVRGPGSSAPRRWRSRPCGSRARDQGLLALDRLRLGDPWVTLAAPLRLPAGAPRLRGGQGPLPADLGGRRGALRAQRPRRSGRRRARYELAGPETSPTTRSRGLVARAGRPPPPHPRPAGEVRPGCGRCGQSSARRCSPPGRRPS